MPCKICDGPASLYGVFDLNRPCQTAHAHRPPPAGVVTYDPMVAEHATRPDRKFDLPTCFETLEQVPDPLATIGAMTACVAEPGAVFYSTWTQPDEAPTAA
ncbi:methyltransferase domain-containing protein [Bradyrhizobium oligotrophicum S58]